MGETILTMEDYIERSSSALEENLSRRDELTRRIVELYLYGNSVRLSRIRLIASGSSYNSCRSIQPFMERILDTRVDVMSPSSYSFDLDLLDRIEPAAFELFVSQSGCSTNVIEALRAAGSRNHVRVALTGNLEADLRSDADKLIEFGVGNETVDYVTLGVVTLMEFLALFALRAAVASGKLSVAESDSWLSQLSCVPELHRLTLGKARRIMDRQPQRFLAPGPVFMCGAGPCFGVALEAALKWQETLKCPAMAYEPEEYIHGPNLQLTPNMLAFFIDAQDRAGRTFDIYRATREVTDRAYMVTANSGSMGQRDDNVIAIDTDIDPILAPLYLVCAPQLFCARTMRLLGCEEAHPLLKRFEGLVRCKTEDYEEIMIRKAAAARKAFP